MGLAGLAGLAVAAGSWAAAGVGVGAMALGVPDELFNLTQLAEVSLAAAAAQGHRFRRGDSDADQDADQQGHDDVSIL